MPRPKEAKQGRRTAARILLTLVLGLALGGSYVAGAMRGAAGGKEPLALAHLFLKYLACPGGSCGYNDATGRERLACEAFAGAPTARRAVVFSLGQSNGGNHGDTPFAPRKGVANFNWLDGSCYQATDPLLGTTGEGGSPWSRMGDQMLATGNWDDVLLVPISVGGSGIRRWLPDGDLAMRISETLGQLSEAGIEVTHVAWHQGEADAGYNRTGEEYIADFEVLLHSLRSQGLDAPVYVAIATLCKGTGNEEIQGAQRAIPGLFEGVYPGANTDRLDRFVHRYDFCHMSEVGLAQHARLWVDAFQANPAVALQPRVSKVTGNDP